VRLPPIFCQRKARIDDCHLVCSSNSPSRGANNPYAQIDTNYEMNDVKSTTNLTAGLSGGANESMADFYNEVTFLSPYPRLLPVAMGYQHQPIPDPSLLFLTLIFGPSPPILDLLHPRRYKAVQHKRRPHLRTPLEVHQHRR